MTEKFSAIEDVERAIGSAMGPTSWFAVNQDRIDGFADATGDHQWIHVDIDRAADGPFGGTIAHGYLTLSLIPQFGAQLFKLDFGSARLNYGLGKVRFPAPVPAGARIRASAEFAGLKPLSTGSLLSTRYTIELENSPKPACIAEALTLLLP
jgi:acyl dehydratase